MHVVYTHLKLFNLKALTYFSFYYFILHLSLLKKRKNNCFNVLVLNNDNFFVFKRCNTCAKKYACCMHSNDFFLFFKWNFLSKIDFIN